VKTKPIRLRGVLEPLPPGEIILWQGAPSWIALAHRAFHVRHVAVYFAVFLIWRVTVTLADGGPVAAAAISALWILLPALAAAGLLSVLAWLFAATTRYTITSRRVVMQIGVALPTIINIPFRRVAAVALKTYKSGSGDIPLQTLGEDQIAYLLLWPHVRPWRFARPEPMLRAVPDAVRVAEILAQAAAAETQPVSEPSTSVGTVVQTSDRVAAVAAA
jgi:Bacterial PH domain